MTDVKVFSDPRQITTANTSTRSNPYGLNLGVGSGSEFESSPEDSPDVSKNYNREVEPRQVSESLTHLCDP